MSTLWWIVVTALTFVAGFCVGAWLRSEYERYQRQVVQLDFTRRKVGL